MRDPASAEAKGRALPGLQTNSPEGEHHNGYTAVSSHRSGETADTFIADFIGNNSTDDALFFLREPCKG